MELLRTLRRRLDKLGAPKSQIWGQAAGLALASPGPYGAAFEACVRDLVRGLKAARTLRRRLDKLGVPPRELGARQHLTGSHHELVDSLTCRTPPGAAPSGARRAPSSLAAVARAARGVRRQFPFPALGSFEPHGFGPARELVLPLEPSSAAGVVPALCQALPRAFSRAFARAFPRTFPGVPARGAERPPGGRGLP